jgi:hypothetical protein
MNRFSKQPSEEYVIGVEFAGRLPSGASLSFGTVHAYDATGTDVTDAVLTTQTVTITGTQARAKAVAGQHGQDYRLRFLLTLSTTDILEEDVLMEIRNK